MNSWLNHVGTDIADRYRLESLLGVGSFGAVYTAVDTKAQQPIMLRLLRAELGGQATLDATVLTDFRHPHAVAVSDVGGFQESRFLVMPRVTGVRIRVRDPWPVERVLEFVRQVSAPLIAFQKHYDLQHLHLHPGNIFMEESAGKLRFQVADLGLASQVGAGPLILEAIRERRSTPEFLSPEQLQGNVPSLQSDVYAFGAMLFQLLSGLPPFPYSGESLSSYALRVAKTPPPRFRDVNDRLNIDPYLESILMRCLSKSPEGRLGSIQEFVDAYEMAYRDFQTRTLSGLKLSELDAPFKEIRTANPAAPFKPTPPKEHVPADLPASDMLPGALRLPFRDDQIPYRALPHGTDTNVAIPSGPSASRTVFQESHTILQSVNPQLNPWSGMGGELPKHSVPGAPPRPPAVSTIPEPPRPILLRAEQDSLHEPPKGMLETMSPSVPQDSFSSAAVPQRGETSPVLPPEAFQIPRESEWGQFSSGSSSFVDSSGVDQRHAAQTMSSSSEPPSDFGRRNDSNLTMQMQQDWLRSQGLAINYKPVTHAPTVTTRPNVKRLGPPNAVLILLAAIVVVVGGLGLYGYMAAERVRENVKAFVAKDQYFEAKVALENAHPLVGIRMSRDVEIKQLLTDGLAQVEQRRKSKDLSAAVKLTGQLEAAFGNEPIEGSGQPKKIRQEIATILREQALELAGTEHLKLALEKAVSSDEADAFKKVAKTLSASNSDFDVVEVKRAIFRKAFSLADKHSENGQHSLAFNVLDAWRQKLITDDDIRDEDKEKLKGRHCEERVLKTLDEAREEARPGRARFLDAEGMLDSLLRDFGTGSCTRRRPAILHARGQLRLAWAESKIGSESEIGKRFDDSLQDLTEAIAELEKQPVDVSASQIPPTKTEVLKTRAAALLARGLCNESRSSVEKPIQPIRDAIRDFQAALVDVPKLEKARHRLQVIRETAQAAADEAFQLARTESSQAKADNHYCEADRQFTLVIEATLPGKDDALGEYARLLRGLVRSSFKEPDYSNAIADLGQATLPSTELRLIEISQKLLPETDVQIREFQLRYLVAVSRSRLAWLIATCRHDDIRNETKNHVNANEQAQRAQATLMEMIVENESGRLKLNEELLDKLRRDACYARKALAMTWADQGQFDKARLVIETLLGSLDPEAKGWESDERVDLGRLLQNHVEQRIPYRVSPSLGTARRCSEK